MLEVLREDFVRTARAKGLSRRAVLWGHVHQAFDGMRGGLMLMGTPSTCVQFESGSTKFALDERPPGYRWLHLYPDGRIDTRVEWVEGET